MKHIILLILLLLFAGRNSFAQSEQRERSHFLHAARRLHASNGERGNAPPNDDCASAQALIVSADCTTPINGDNTAATNDGPDASCDDPGADLQDVWYTFNSGAEDTVTITLSPSAQMTDRAFVVYDACGGNEVICRIAPTTAVYVPVMPNTTYWLRVYSNPTYGDPGPFTLCVALPGDIPPPPANDVCSNAVAQLVSLGGSATFNGTTLGAMDNEGFGYPAVWEAFTLDACADVKISYCGSAPAWNGFWLLLYDGCPPASGVFPGSYDSTACGDGNFTICFAHLAAGSYRYPVVSGPVGDYTLNVSAVACGTDQASNDDCPGAIPITAHTTCTPDFFTNPCATQSLPAVTCGSFTGDATDDVWYNFVATSVTMTVGGAPHGNMDIVMELFSGTCGSLTSIACGDVGGPGVADDMVATGLTIGSTYYFRVYDFRNQYSYADPGYELCVVDGMGSGVGVEETTTAAQGSLYPNPSNGTFTIRANSGAMITAMQVIDAAGRTVLRSAFNTAHGPVHVDASALTPGAYVVRFTDGGSLMNERLIIQKP